MMEVPWTYDWIWGYLKLSPIDEPGDQLYITPTTWWAPRTTAPGNPWVGTRGKWHLPGLLSISFRDLGVLHADASNHFDILASEITQRAANDGIDLRASRIGYNAHPSPQYGVFHQLLLEWDFPNHLSFYDRVFEALVEEFVPAHDVSAIASEFAEKEESRRLMFAAGAEKQAEMVPNYPFTPETSPLIAPGG